MDDLSKCTITDEEFEEFVDGNGISLCSDFGDCENCPFCETEDSKDD